MPSTIPHLLQRLRGGQHASSPRLTWYGPDGERIELSGRVLENWVAKTSNFLTEELDAEIGTRVRIALPAHWKSAVIALAAWQVGAVVVDDPGIPVDVTFVGPDFAADDAAPSGGALVAVALGALEMGYPGQLPAGAYDYAAAVRQFADSYEPFDAPAEDDAAYESGSESFSQAELSSGFAAPAAAGARVLVPAREGLRASLSRLLGAWAADGSAVLVHAQTEEAEDGRALERIRQTEKVTGA
ncbi:TIGR03089 family protein [Sinomonas sp. RB5]